MKDTKINILICLLIGQTILGYYSIKSIITNIEKHSVHPLFGNYKKFDSRGEKCEPWDSCR
jgi:hypothetical protein